MECKLKYLNESILIVSMTKPTINFKLSQIVTGRFLLKTIPFFGSKLRVVPMLYLKSKNPRKLFTCKGLRFIKAVRTGLEPATPCVTGMYSNQLNYRTVSQQYINVRDSFFKGLQK